MQGIINWSAVSLFLAGNRTGIRNNNHPQKYKKKVEQLQYYVDCWEKGIELTSMEELKRQLKDKIDEI